MDTVSAHKSNYSNNPQKIENRDKLQATGSWGGMLGVLLHDYLCK